MEYLQNIIPKEKSAEGVPIWRLKNSVLWYAKIAALPKCLTAFADSAENKKIQNVESRM